MFTCLLYLFICALNVATDGFVLFALHWMITEYFLVLNMASSSLNNERGIWWNLQNFLWSCQFSLIGIYHRGCHVLLEMICFLHNFCVQFLWQGSWGFFRQNQFSRENRLQKAVFVSIFFNCFGYWHCRSLLLI